jgi:hypothetical protein
MQLNEARELVSALANGTDPETGEILPAQSPYNDPRVIRALFTVLNSSNGRATKKSPEQKMEENLSAGRPKNAGLPWTDDLRARLAEMFQGGTELGELAIHFERTNGAILSELTRQGLVDWPGASEMK